MAGRRDGRPLDWKLIGAVAVVPLVLAIALAIVVATRGSSDDEKASDGGGANTTTTIPVAPKSAAYGSFCLWSVALQEPLAGLVAQVERGEREVVLELIDTFDREFEATPPPDDLPADVAGDLDVLVRELAEARSQVASGPDVIEPDDLPFDRSMVAAIQHLGATYLAQCPVPDAGG